MERDLSLLRRAVSTFHLQEIIRNLPEECGQIFTADLIADDWSGFVGDNGFEKYVEEFSCMPVYAITGSRETWTAWFADLGWVGAVDVLDCTQGISSSTCLQFLRSVLTDGNVECPHQFQNLSGGLMPWLAKGTVSRTSKGDQRKRRYRAHFGYRTCEKNFDLHGPSRVSHLLANSDLATLRQVKSSFHMRELRQNISGPDGR